MDISWCEKYLGIPYVSLGRDFKGVDCYGLVYLVYKNELGIELPLVNTNYNNGLVCKEVAPLFEKNLDLFIKKGLVKETNYLNPYNLILFRRSGYISHIGICLHDNLFIHADLGSETCIENVKRNYWKHRKVGVYELASSC
ncbi:MAG: hypothetical protein EOM04_08795 [Clostridia bacterium]|nr:hypothetical protein [Clostridia bacterium]